MDTSSLTFKTLKNASYNIVGYVWPMALALFVTPVIVLTLGAKEYGIYLFVNNIISLFGLLEFGITTAATKHISHYHAQGNTDAIERTVRSTNSLFLIIATVGLALSIGIAIAGPALLPSQFEAYAPYAWLFVWSGIVFFFSAILMTYSATLNALQRYDISVKIGMVFLTASSLSALAVVLAGGGLRGIFMSQIVITALSSLVTYLCAKSILPATKYGIGWDRTAIKESYSFGLFLSLNNIATSISRSATNLIIPFFAGPTNLTYFGMAQTVAQKIPGVSNALGNSLFPMASQLHGANNHGGIAVLYKRSSRLIALIAAALSTTAAAFAYKALYYWLDPTFADKAAPILVILAVAHFVLALYGPLSNFLLGIGKLKFVTVSSVIMAVLSVIFLFVLMPRFGIMGAAWAQTLSLLPVIYMFYYTERHYLSLAGTGRRKHHFRQAFGILVTSTIVWLIDTYLFMPLANSLTAVLTLGAISGILYIGLYKLLGFFEEEDWRDLSRFALFVFKRKPNAR